MSLQSKAVYLKGPRDLDLAVLPLREPGPNDLVVEISHSGISTGTEKLFWTGQMPPFPGSGWPLVPGYEATGEVVEAGIETEFRVGDRVFVPGANCFEGAYALFGGAAERVVTDADRVVSVDSGLNGEGALLALAATAWHTMSGAGNVPPDLIVGHGVLGRLLARLALVTGTGEPPTVWETNPARRGGAMGYEVLSPDDDPRRDYKAVYDASGNVDALDTMIGRMARGGELVLAGFYPDGVQFAFPPAFLRETRLRIAAEWSPEDLRHVSNLVAAGTLSLDGLISHTRPASAAKDAYRLAFESPDCLKMMLTWRDAA